MKPQQLSRKKLRWFRIIALSIPVLILLLAEGLLRLFNYGHDTSLFIRYPDDNNYWVINKYASEKYFTDTANATKGNIEPFKVVKAKNTFRIFVLGESTTAGYPYLHNGSFHRWLQYRLMHTYPDVNFEVVNVSLTAVNSYTVLDFGKQVVNYQPDAVLIYTGHNEYYGALGIGSTSHIANNRFLVQTLLSLKELRLVQMANNIIGSFKPVSSKPDQRDNLMERMAKQQSISYHSEAYRAGVTQFKDNMTELCRFMQDKKIPVFLSTLVSNEKDLKPFISDTSDTSANLQYAQASDSYQAGKYRQAKQEFVRAKELDLLRFRAPEAMNDIITGMAKQFGNVHLVNARAVFEQHSPKGILGNETLLEHVHPNLYGYALLSEAFYQSLENAKLIKARADHEMSLTELLSRMPVTKVDSLYGAYTIMMLKAGWPFNQPIPANFKRSDDISAQLAGALSVNRISWLDAMDQLFKYCMKTGDKKTALKAVEAVMLEKPQNTTYPIYAGRLSFEMGDSNGAAFYFKKAYQLDPSFANTQTMYLVFLKSDQPAKATPYIDSAIRQHPSDIELVNLKAIVGEIIRLKNTTEKKAYMQIAADYHAIGADEAAVKYKQQ
ncbi:GDSL-type esterase/lipase family protein [Mucilaginibacter kameinonensis]|uniref:GDSL-type esterase/lipase family protein n=1 Tax=Mucilaginibacter kameinonensis TaxID=452286 RepID=UPI0013CF3086|nr:GDSL-type esterase/lipase family protein [Mucilaginibacter kameinonensis]